MSLTIAPSPRSRLARLFTRKTGMANHGAQPVVIETIDQGSFMDRASFNIWVGGHTLDGSVSITFFPTVQCGYEASALAG